ncbi:MAG: biopolymer transporter ExbD [Flavobacteriales bacterium]|nr:biopolymer transporter ExbD [Flavobacteriales bacterium]
MPRLRSIKKLPKLDMNPMVDMAFLLVTFFMMTTTFKADMPAEIVIPFSKAELKIPDKDLCMITIDKDGRVFIGLDNKFDRKQMLAYVAQQNGLQLSVDDAERFSLLSSFGVPFEELSAFVTLEKTARKLYPQSGIPTDVENDQLRHWLIGSRLANPSLRFAINGDQETPVYAVKRVFDILQDLNITRFNLITDTEKDAS